MATAIRINNKLMSYFHNDSAAVNVWMLDKQNGEDGLSPFDMVTCGLAARLESIVDRLKQ